MKTRKMYESKEQFEKLHPYLVVNLDGRNGIEIVKDCSCKRTADNYVRNYPHIFTLSVMTRKQYEKEIS